MRAFCSSRRRRCFSRRRSRRSASRASICSISSFSRNCSSSARFSRRISFVTAAARILSTSRQSSRLLNRDSASRRVRRPGSCRGSPSPRSGAHGRDAQQFRPASPETPASTRPSQAGGSSRRASPRQRRAPVRRGVAWRFAPAFENEGGQLAAPVAHRRSQLADDLGDGGVQVFLPTASTLPQAGIALP
jgi:hypothetical protein